MTTLVVIPSRYERDRLRSLLLSITDADVLVLDNGHEPPLGWGNAVEVRDARGLGIYAMWNLGVRLARERGYAYVALANDDVRILPGTFRVLERAIESDRRLGVVYPDWPLRLDRGLPRRVRVRPTSGTVSVGGMTGFLFLVRTAIDVPFDEGFGWWYGDDAFEREVRRRRWRVGRVLGLPCEHESDSEADGWARRPELREVSERDRARWEALG